MRLSTLMPKTGDNLWKYLTFYVASCAVSFPTIFLLLGENPMINLSLGFLGERCLQGIVVGIIGGFLVYLYERRTMDSAESSATVDTQHPSNV